MFTILALPAELLDLICKFVGFLEDDFRNKTLLSVMLSGKPLYHAARATLYRSLGRFNRRFPFRKVLQILAHRPDTADLVTELHLGTWDNWSFYHQELKPSLLNRLITTIKSTKIPDDLQSHILQGLRAGDQDALICALLILCKKVTLLDMTLELQLARTVTMRLVEQSASLEGVLDRLNVITARASTTPSYTDLNEVLPAWKIPTLQSFLAEEVKYINCPPMLDNQAMFNLRSITLSKCMIDSSGLERILTLCPKLHSIHIKLANPGNVVSRFPYSYFGSTLNRLGSGLESLTFRGGLPHNVQISRRVPVSALGDLTGMTNLRSLYTTWEALLGPEDSRFSEQFIRRPTYLADTLPSSLELLSFWAETFYPQIPEVADAQLLELMKSKRLEKLHTISIMDGASLALTPPYGWMGFVDEQGCLFLERAKNGKPGPETYSRKDMCEWESWLAVR